MELATELSQSISERITRLDTILNHVTEEDLNKQPLPNKKTAGEIFSHILFIDSLPLWFMRLFYGSFNLFNGLYTKMESKPIRATADTWDLDHGKPRSPKKISKEKLSQKLDKIIPKLQQRAQQLSAKQLNAVKVLERHGWGHLAQIELLLTMDQDQN